MKRFCIACLMAALYLLHGGMAVAAKPHKPLKISGPPVAESLVFAVMAEQMPEKVVFLPWHSPDQARALIAGKKVDASIITTSGAANLSNKKIAVRIAGVFHVPLWVISTTSDSGPLPLKGTLLFPFGHREMPELVFEVVIGKTSDLETRHAGGALETVTALLLGKAQHALLAEPAATMSITDSAKNGSPLVKHLDLRVSWEEKFSGKPLYVSALAVFRDAINETTEIENLRRFYNHTLVWMKAHPAETLSIARKRAPAVFALLKDNEKVITPSRIFYTQADFNAARFFLDRLYQNDRKVLGGKVPGDELFFNPDQCVNIKK